MNENLDLENQENLEGKQENEENEVKNNEDEGIKEKENESSRRSIKQQREEQEEQEEQEEEDNLPVSLKQKPSSNPSIDPSSSFSSFSNINSNFFHSSLSSCFSSLSILLLYLKDFLVPICRDFTPYNLFQIFQTFKKSLQFFFFLKRTSTIEIFYIITGLFSTFITEIFLHSPKYNLIILLTLIISISFSSFPKNSIRPQLVITILFFLSLLLDILYLIHSPKIVSIACKVFLVFSMLSKLLAIYDFLFYSEGSKRVRKYLIRRVRVFLFPLTRPRRIMREIRARILALEWIQFVILPLLLFL